jgi:hypothetical protein
VSSKGGPYPFDCARFRVTKVSGGGQPSLTIASRDFAKGECQSLILQLARSRVARGASTWALANGYMWRALTKREISRVSDSIAEKQDGTPGRPLAASRAISALRPSRLQHAKSSSVIFRSARCRENLGPGPTASPGEVRTVRSRRTRGARLSLLGISLLAISISKG